jgi:hypothetical protein
MKNIIFLLLFCFVSIFSRAQNHGRFWYFGENAGLDFSTSPPTALNDGVLNVVESCSSISDDLGNLLFYTDGTTVWNKNHVPMTNGTGLNGNSSSAQQMIIRNRATTNIFYILTVSGSNGLSYSMVDMLAGSGLGDVVASSKNISINQNTVEKVTAYINPSVTTSWVLTFKDGIYYAYGLNGVFLDILNPVISSLPTTDNMIDARGMLKLSPDGTKLINTSVGLLNIAYLTDFDPITGIVSNPITLSSSTIYDRFYGAEFSPDSRLVYLNANSIDTGNACGNNNTREIFQYEMNGAAGWNSNPVLLGGMSITNSGRSSLQLGPDGKIYAGRTCLPWLGVILNPTIVGTGASYIDEGVALAAGTLSREGLPNVALQSYSNTFNTIQGNIAYDMDSNGCGSTDPSFLPSSFMVTSTTVNGVFYSRIDGNYGSTLPNGQFTVTPQPENPSYWNFSPPNVVVNFPTQSSPFTQDFCVTANGAIEDLEVIVLPLELARPGFDTDYKVVIKNKGNVTTSGSVTLDFEEDFMTLLSSNPNAGNTPSNQLSWSFSNLQPFQMEEYEFTMTLNTPTATVNPLNSNDILTFTGTVTGMGTDAMPADNTMVFDQTVLNSYDPNDKTCLEGKIIEPSLVGEYVHYIIRFENTGTASAVNIVVKDEIDLGQFDITTLIPLGGSHDYYTRVRDNNVVEFIHKNINLDFNDATNDGYVLFKIKTLNTLIEGDTFDNTAEIYFDFNLPIITNTETVTIMSTASIGETTDTSISVYPNPARDVINITSTNGLKSATLIDVNGRRLSQTNFIGNTTEQRISLENLTSGVYFVTIQSEEGQKVEKVIVE